MSEIICLLEWGLLLIDHVMMSLHREIKPPILIRSNLAAV